MKQLVGKIWQRLSAMPELNDSSECSEALQDSPWHVKDGMQAAIHDKDGMHHAAAAIPEIEQDWRFSTRSRKRRTKQLSQYHNSCGRSLSVAWQLNTAISTAKALQPLLNMKGKGKG